MADLSRLHAMPADVSRILTPSRQEVEPDCPGGSVSRYRVSEEDLERTMHVGASLSRQQFCLRKAERFGVTTTFRDWNTLPNVIPLHHEEHEVHEGDPSSPLGVKTRLSFELLMPFMVGNVLAHRSVEV